MSGKNIDFEDKKIKKSDFCKNKNFIETIKHTVFNQFLSIPFNQIIKHTLKHMITPCIPKLLFKKISFFL